MPKQLRHNDGHLKLYFTERKNNFNQEMQNEVIEANILFFGNSEKRGRIAFNFLNIDYSIDVFFKNDIEKEVHPNFLFPRLKKNNEEYFILSGLFKRQDETWLAVGKFEGRIPVDYLQYPDELKYTEDYWN